ncbi:DUF6087 family protein [Streptomyces sp. NPDC054863]
MHHLHEVAVVLPGEWLRLALAAATDVQLEEHPGPHRGSHVQPDAPRLVEEWNGTEWVNLRVVDNLAAAQALLYPPPAKEKPAEWDRPAPGKGRHRKPSPADGRKS